MAENSQSLWENMHVSDMTIKEHVFLTLISGFFAKPEVDEMWKAIDAAHNALPKVLKEMNNLGASK